MSETVKINLHNTLVLLTMAIMLAGVVGAAYIAYDDAKESKAGVAALRTRMQTIETTQARFEGIIDERTKNTAKRVDDIYDIVKEWEVK